MTVPFIRKSTQRISSWPGDSELHQRPNTFAQTCQSPLRFSLAVVRRTIHFWELRDGTCPASRLYGQLPSTLPMIPFFVYFDAKFGSSFGRIVSGWPTIRKCEEFW